MNSKRLFYTFLGLFILGVGLVFASVLYSKTLLDKETVKLVELKTTSQALLEQQQALLNAKRSLKEYAELESITGAIVPKDKNEAKTVREIIKFASETNVFITSLSFPTSSLGDKNKSSPGSSQTTSDSNSKLSTSQLTPVSGIPGLFEFEIGLESGSEPVLYQNFLNFLDKLEKNRRTAHVTSVSIQPSSEDRSRVTFSLRIKVFVKP